MLLDSTSLHSSLPAFSPIPCILGSLLKTGFFPLLFHSSGQSQHQWYVTWSSESVFNFLNEWLAYRKPKGKHVGGGIKMKKKCFLWQTDGTLLSVQSSWSQCARESHCWWAKSHDKIQQWLCSSVTPWRISFLDWLEGISPWARWTFL